MARRDDDDYDDRPRRVRPDGSAQAAGVILGLSSGVILGIGVVLLAVFAVVAGMCIIISIAAVTALGTPPTPRTPQAPAVNAHPPAANNWNKR